MKLGNDKSWKAFGNAAKPRPNSFHVDVEEHHRGGRTEGDQNGAWYFLGVLEAENHYRNGKNRNRGRRHGEGAPCKCKRLHAMKKITGDVLHLQAKEVADLRA